MSNSNITIVRDGQTIRLDPPDPHVTAALEVVRHRYHLDDSHVVATHESLLDPHPPRANAGLMLPIARLLSLRGITPCVRSVTPLAALDAPGLASDDIASLIAANSHGLIVASAVEVVAELHRAFPQARICVLSASRKRIVQIGRDVTAQIPDATIMRRATSPPRTSRVIVGTFTDMANPDLEFQNADIVLLLDAREALREEAQSVLMTAGARFRLFGLLPFNCELCSYDARRLMAIFGPVRLELPGHQGQRFRETAVAWLQIRGEGATNESYHQSRSRGYWDCHFRNRRIARFAAALSDPHQTFASRPKLAEYLSRLYGRRIAIVVANLTHAGNLARYLPDWPIVASAIGADPFEDFDTRSTAEQIADRIIITQEQLVWGEIHDMDVVVWAAGGEIGATSVRFLFTCPVGVPQPLLVVDCDDRHGLLLKHWSKQRRRAYKKVGWLGLGVDPTVSRIDAFLASHPVSTE